MDHEPGLPTPVESIKLNESGLPPLPENWTILFHGTNLGRDEWQNGRDDVLKQDSLAIKTRYPGLSCITLEDKREARNSRRGTGYDTTRNYSTIAPGHTDLPMEIRILFPAFHDRKKGSKEIFEAYERKYGTEISKKLRQLLNKTHFLLNQQHPVVPNGTELRKLADYLLDDGRRVVWYIPKDVEAIYHSELASSQ